MIRDGDDELRFSGLTQNVDYFPLLSKSNLDKYGTLVKNYQKTLKNSLTGKHTVCKYQQTEKPDPLHQTGDVIGYLIHHRL